MPGYDRTGPLGAGPRTGRGLGRCGQPADRTTSVGAPDQGYGLGWGGRPWGGGRGRGFGGGGWGRRWGFGMGRGFGMAWRPIEDPAGLGATARQQETFLMRQMEELRAAMDQLKEFFSKSSPAEGQDRE